MTDKRKYGDGHKFFLKKVLFCFDQQQVHTFLARNLVLKPYFHKHPRRGFSSSTKSKPTPVFNLQKNIQPEIRNPKLKYDKIEKLFGYLDSSNFASNLEKFNIENQKHYKEEKKTKKKNFFNFCFC